MDSRAENSRQIVLGSATACPASPKLPLPLPRKKPQSDDVRVAPKYALPLAALLRGEVASATLTSPLKTRVGFFCRRPPGRHRARRAQVARLASSCRAHGYETASGRGFWLSRDPIEEQGNQLLRIDPAALMLQASIDRKSTR